MRVSRFRQLPVGAVVVAGLLAVSAPPAALAAGQPAAVRPAVTTGDGFHPLAQARVYSSGLSPLRAGADRTVPIAGLGGVPSSGADAVLVNVEVANPTSAGYLRVTPSSPTSPTAVQEFAAGQTVSALVPVKLVNGGILLHLSAGQASIFIDVSGYWTTAPADGFNPLKPQRVYYSGATQLSHSTDRQVTIAGLGGVPATGADAVLVNVEVQKPSAAGYLRVTPGGTTSQTAVQEFGAGQAISNMVAVRLSSTGTISLHISAGHSDVFVDVLGYWTATGGESFIPLTQTRAYASGAHPLVAGTDKELTMTGIAGIPSSGVDSVLVNVEIQSPTQAGYVRVTPGNVANRTATQEFTPGETISNLVSVQLSSGGAIRLHLSAGTATYFVDVEGYTPTP
jgi:hypothetical protein